jgi:hypothetical protein
MSEIDTPPDSDHGLDLFRSVFHEWLEANGVELIGTSFDRKRIFASMDLNVLLVAIHRLIIESGGSAYPDTERTL